jgi:hypothetical protein
MLLMQWLSSAKISQLKEYTYIRGCIGRLVILQTKLMDPKTYSDLIRSATYPIALQLKDQ